MGRGIVPHLWVADIEKSCAFYKESLGFESRMRWPETGAMSWCLVGLGDAEIMIATFPPLREGEGPSTGFEDKVRERGQGKSACTLYIEVPDVNAHHERTRESGPTFPDPIADRFWGQREYTVEDPDGNWLTFWEPLRDRSAEN